MHIDPMRVAMHGISSGGIFALHNSNGFSMLGSRVESFVIYGSSNIAPDCNFMQGHLLMVRGEQDYVVKWGDVVYEEFQTCGTRKIITRVTSARGYDLTADDTYCAEACARGLAVCALVVVARVVRVAFCALAAGELLVDRRLKTH